MSRAKWFVTVLLVAMAAPDAWRVSIAGERILSLQIGTGKADAAVARALRETRGGPADAERASRLCELARTLEEEGRDDLALVVHRVIADRYPAAEMPAGISGVLFADESRVRIAWLSGDRSWLAADFRTLHARIVDALRRREPATLAALAPPHVRVGPFRACPDGWSPRKVVASELAASVVTTGALDFDGSEMAWFQVTLRDRSQRVIVMGLARGRAEWQAYCYDESAATPGQPTGF